VENLTGELRNDELSESRRRKISPVSRFVGGKSSSASESNSLDESEQRTELIESITKTVVALMGG
jgi:hypothetical protein